MKDLPEANGAFEFTTNLDFYWNLANTWLAFGELKELLETKQDDGIIQISRNH